jgi:methyl-accepting chemotaxis protein
VCGDNVSNGKTDFPDTQDVLYGLADNLNYLVNREHQIIGDELEQMSALVSDAIKTLVKSFNNLNINMVDQAELVQEIVSAASSEKNNSTDEHQQEFLKLGQEMKQNIATTVRSFQFEDIVQQLVVHCRTRSNGMEQLFSRLDKGLKQLKMAEKEQAIQIVNDMQKDVAEVRELLERENPVKQDSMSAGGIELF